MNSSIAAVDVFPVAITLPHPVGDGQGLQAARRSMFIRITAADGTYGWGEGGSAIPGAYQIRNGVAAALIGLDALDTDVIHNRAARAGIGGSTLGGVDIAAWDLKGKLTGQSIARMLGGVLRTRVPAYASLHNYSAAADCANELVDLIRDARRQGFRALKMKIGGRSIEEDLAYIRLAREVGGADFGLMADANQTYELGQAVRVGRALEQAEFVWFEEPLVRIDPRGYALLRQKLDIPIAGGEGATSPTEIQELLDFRAIDISQPDVAGVGGFTQARHLPRIAQLWGAAPTWHVWNAPLIQVATLHVLANQAPWRYLSMSPEAAPLEVTIMPNAMRDRVLVGAPSVDHDGMLTVPSTPGLGVDVDLAVLAEFAHSP